MRTRLSGTTVLYYAEGRSTIVSVLESGPSRSIRFDGKIEASDILADVHHEYMLGHLPVLLHPDPKRALVIGMGAGLTLGGVVAHPGLERIVLAEIEPAAIGGSAQFSELNGDPLRDPRVEVLFEDGRHAVRALQERFDVVTSDPIHPWTYGSAYLYTEEYFGMVAGRLAPGGIACQWLPLYELDARDLQTVVASFARAFPHTTVWQASRDALLIGSDRPVTVDPTALEARLRTPTVRGQLARIGIVDATSFLAELALDERAVAAWSEGAVVNTDDNLVLEFASPRSIGGSYPKNAALLDERRATIDVVAPALAALGAQRLDAIRRAKTATLAVGKEEVAQEDPAARPALEAALEPLARGGYGPARVLLAELLAKDALESRALAVAERAVDTWPESDTAWLARAVVEVATGGDGRASFETALALHRNRAWALRQFGVALAEAGRFEDAAATFTQLLELRPDEADASYFLGQSLVDAGRPDAGLPHLARAWAAATKVPMAEAYARALGRSGDLAGAASVLEAAIAVHPDDASLRANLEQIRRR